ncbi:MAG: hypothetical protein GY704_04460 [Phycisphaeraceae bacterium]|nr:hypothetical protein [Phycisphaeraceae bacterium]
MRPSRIDRMTKRLTCWLLSSATLLAGCGPGTAPTPPRLVGSVQTDVLRSIDDAPVPLQSEDGRPTLLLVWATYAPDSVAMLSELAEVERRRPDSARVVAAAIQRRSEIVEWLARRDDVASFPIVAGEGSDRTDLVGWAKERPTLWILDPDGRVLGRLEGLQDANAILAEVDRLNDVAPDETKTASTDGPSPLGGCVVERRDGVVPEDLRQRTGVVRDRAFLPFTKHLVAGGMTFVATDDVDDEFMLAVGETQASIMAADAEGIDVELQDAVLRALFRAKTTIPMWRGDEPDFPEDSDWEAFDRLGDRRSICDAIFQLEPDDLDGQPMEVIEHLLHHLNMVGLHDVFPEDWGISRASTLHAAMRTALDRSWYVVDYLDEFDDEEEADRVLLQEYAYWVISSEWDLQRAFGPGHDEWTLVDPETFRNAQPELHEAYLRTIPRVLVAPSPERLRAFRDRGR